jgi:hypothetical protein
MKRPGDEQPEPPGGRAAERLREFLRERLPAETPSEEAQNENESGGTPGTKSSRSDKNPEPGR